MISIRDMMTCAPLRISIRGAEIELSRPSALDLLEALEVSKVNPERLYAWFVFRHLHQDGARVFASVDEVLASSAPLVIEIGREVERLYEEGRD